MKDLREITEALERGVSEVFTGERFAAYLDAMSRFYDYSAGNCLLIMMQRPDATLVASFRKWQSEFRRCVKKGERAIYILAPVQHKHTATVQRPDGSEEERETSWLSFRPVPVFDVGQTDGEPLPTLVEKLTGTVDGYEALVEKLIAAAGIPVTVENIKGGANGCYNSQEDRIRVRSGMSEEQTVKTLLHEIAHSILHRKGGEEENADRMEREVQAESVAYVVCRWLGIDASGYSFGYVAGWSKGRDTKTLTGCLETVRKTAKQIIEAVEAACAA